MRELTKSLGSFGWAMSLFGLKRLAEMLSPQATHDAPPGGRPGAGGHQTEAFDRVTDAAREHLGDGGFHEIFRSGDQIFRGMIDMMLGGGCSDCPPGWTSSDPRTGAWPGGPRPSAGSWEPPSGRPAPPGGWGPMPADASPPPTAAASAPPAAGGWGPMPGAQASAADPNADEAGARGWGPMPPVPPPGAPKP